MRPIKPTFQGDPRNDADLARYEEQVRRWEEACANYDHEQLQKAVNPESFEEALRQLEGEVVGPGGPPGPPGLDGMNGAPGSKWWNGDGDPNLVSDFGSVGDYYLDTEGDGAGEGDVWLKTNIGWVLQGNIEGPQGPAGADGQDGNDWRTGSGAPGIPGPGDLEGDLYLDTANGDVYQVQSSTWVLIDNITGPAGATGPGVPTGGTADQYLAKIDGTNFNTEWRPFQETKLYKISAGTGTQAVAGTVSVTWSTEQINIPAAAPWITQDSSTEFTIAETGYYLLGFNIDIDTTTSTMTESRVRVNARWRRDTGGGFGDMGHTVQIAEDSEFMDNQSLQQVFPELLTAGTAIQVVCQKVSGDDVLVIRQRNSHMWIMKLENAGPPVIT